MNRRILPLLLFVLGPVFLSAQARLAVYGTVGTEHTGIPNQGWSRAGTLGLYYGLSNLGPVAIAADARADLSSNANSYLFGPRVALHFRVMPIKPYGEFVVGRTNYATQSNASKTSGAFTYRWVFGIDTAIVPHLDWRVLDFSDGNGINTQNATVHMKTLSTGLVLRF